MSSTAISEIQLAANRANAQSSSGPVTAEGKAIASRNNTRHGLAITDVENFRVLAIEDQSAYDQNLADFRTEWNPATATEHDLVNRMVTHQWLRARALRLQELQFDAATGEVTDTKKFELYRRYETSHERGFNKVLGDITRLRAFQLRQQNGFESQKRKNEEHEAKMQRLKHKETLNEIDLLNKIADGNLTVAKAYVAAAKDQGALEFVIAAEKARQQYFETKNS